MWFNAIYFHSCVPELSWNSFVLPWFTFKHGIFYRNTQFANIAPQFKRHLVILLLLNTLKTHRFKSNGLPYVCMHQINTHSTIEINYDLLKCKKVCFFLSIIQLSNFTTICVELFCLRFLSRSVKYLIRVNGLARNTQTAKHFKEIRKKIKKIEIKVLFSMTKIVSAKNW